MKPIGIMSAMPAEIQSIIGAMSVEKTENIGGRDYLKGTIKGRQVVAVCGGIGTENSAMSAAILASRFDVSSIVFTGVAGAIHEALAVGDIVLGYEMVLYDVDHTIFGCVKGQFGINEPYAYSSDSTLMDLAEGCSQKLFPSKKVFRKRILTGNRFLKSKEKRAELKAEFDGWAMEQEGASMGFACTQFKLPYLVLRGMSNAVQGDDKEDYLNYYKQVADEMQQIVLEMLPSFPY